MTDSFWETVIIDSPFRRNHKKHMSSNQKITKTITWKDEIDQIKKNTENPTLYKRIQKIYGHLFKTENITFDGEYC
jgi:hypothetical protein